MPIHLRAQPSDYAPAVLVPGDPRRATYIAEHFFDPGYRLVNEERGALRSEEHKSELQSHLNSRMPSSA